MIVESGRRIALIKECRDSRVYVYRNERDGGGVQLARA